MTKEQPEEKTPQEKINTKQILKLTEETIYKELYYGRLLPSHSG